MPSRPLRIPLHRQLRELRDDHGLFRRDVAAILGVHENSIGNWDRGVKSPGVYHAIAYARAFHRELVVTRRGVVVCALADVLPDVGKLRRATGLPYTAVSARMRLEQQAALNIEKRSLAGASLRLSTVEPYLAALGYKIRLAAAQLLERAS